MALMTSLLLASLAGSALMNCPIPVPAEPEKPWLPSPRREDYPWMSRIEWCERFQNNLEDPARHGTRLVFMGDSITQGWTDLAFDTWSQAFGHLQPLRLGIGGDRTQNLLWRMDQGELKDLNPRVLVLLIGINNLNGGDSPEATARGVQSLVEQMQRHLPSTQLLLLGLLPSGAMADDPLRSRIQETNQRLAALSRERVYYADIGSSFLTSDGSIDPQLMPDFLHPSPEGYRVFAKALAPHLARLFGADVVDVGAIE
jgi:lysophospholipase L1-like esterase